MDENFEPEALVKRAKDGTSDSIAIVYVYGK